MTLFLTSTRIEMRGLLKRCTRIERQNWPVLWSASGYLRGEPILAMVNGAGPERAYAAVGQAAADAVCNIGFCGALDPALRVGDIVLPDEVGGEPIDPPQGSAVAARGPLVTADHVVTTAQEKLALHRAGGIAVDMEARGARQRAKERGLRFYAVKCVSDLAGENLYCDYNRALRDDGSVALGRLAFDALRHPLTCLPELLRLGRRSLLCSERLGEFLASCEF